MVLNKQSSRHWRRVADAASREAPKARAHFSHVCHASQTLLVVVVVVVAVLSGQYDMIRRAKLFSLIGASFSSRQPPTQEATTDEGHFGEQV